jgi:hypothetical protein
LGALKLHERDRVLGGLNVTDAAIGRSPATPEAVRQRILEEETQNVDLHADEPITRTGLEDPPKRAPMTDRTWDADEGPFAM